MRNLKYIFSFLTVVFALALSSCSENIEEVVEYPNWKNTNESYFSNLYATTQSKISAGDSTEWKVLRSWSITADATDHDYNHVVVKVINKGTGSGCPLSTDSVKVHYKGRLLPSASYSDGFVFAQSYYGDYNANTSMPVVVGVMPNTYVTDGLSTALQQMHIGDRWQVYVPYQLGYGKTDTTTPSVPGYSVLVYDVTLVAYYRPGTEVPDSKAKEHGEWIDE